MSLKRVEISMLIGIEYLLNNAPKKSKTSAMCGSTDLTAG